MKAAESFCCKFSPTSWDLEIFTLPLIVGRVKRSRLVFIPWALKAQSVHYLIAHDIPIITEKNF